jgi:predicted hotdog family 3-hydroxylacyl-ACP dehydratase
VSRESIARLIPHQGGMCLWEDVLESGAEGLRCATATHRDPQHPLAVDGRLAALHLIEYGAQLMAIHGALSAGAPARPGVLAALRDVVLDAEFIEDLPVPLIGSAQRLLESPTGAMYACRVESGGRVVFAGRVSVIYV